MPRKDKPRKCSYCHGSKLSDEAFRLVLMSFLYGSSAEGAVKIFKAVLPANVLSEKTIRMYYKKIGNKLFELIMQVIAPDREREEEIAKHRRENPKLHEEMIHAWLLEIHDQLLDQEKGTPLPEAQRSYLFILEEYRKASRSKYGIRNSAKENFALALFRCLSKASIPNAKSISEEKLEQIVAGKTFLALEKELRVNPL